MNFQQIQTALIESAKNGEIRRIVTTFIDYERVLSAKTRQYAEDWLYYSPKDADIQADGQLPTFSDMIYSAVNGYCLEFINTNYSGQLPHGFNAMKYLSEYETLEFYDSQAELDASGEIFQSINSDHYAAVAIDSIYTENWK